MTTVLTYGTFDLLHKGHLNILEQAKLYGEFLIVGVSTDEFNNLKGKKAIIPYEDRALIVNALKVVDFVIDEHSWEQKLEDIKRFKVDVLIMGDDWTGQFDDLPCRVVYLPRTPNISTEEIIKCIKNI